MNEDKKTIAIGIVVADFNKDITNDMLVVAQQCAHALGVVVSHVVHVPGVYDMPLAVKKLLQKDDVEGVITLGVVISGGTAHDVHIAENNARLCADLSVQFEKPVTLSVIGHDVNKQQALERKESYARHGIEAVVQIIQELRRLS